MLKVKDMQDAEYMVLSTINGKVDDGKGNKVDGLSAIEIEHKKCKVLVGSGFTFDERQMYLKHPEKIKGKIITVQYFEETKNQEGGFSLRFPIFKGIREKGV
jgi:DNA ligase-1